MKEEHIMGVKIPIFSWDVRPVFAKGSGEAGSDKKNYSYFSFPIGMEKSIKKFEDTFSLMLELANIEHSARLLSFEIEKTRRRVNALEYIIIPQIVQNIKLIRAKLDENERAEKIIRLIVKSQIT